MSRSIARKLLDPNLLVLLGNCREGNYIPALLLKHMANEVILMKPLHDQDNSVVLLVIEPTDERVVVPLVR